MRRRNCGFRASPGFSGRAARFGEGCRRSGPRADVTLVNESTNVSRTTTTNAAGEYTFPNLVPGNYTLKVSLAGLKTYAQPDIRVGTQQFLTLDVTLEVGRSRKRSPSPAQSAADRDVERVDRHGARHASMQTLPSAGRTAFLMGTTVPTVIPSGDAQFNRQQDQTNVSLMSLGGGTRRGNNYTLDGVPITDIRNRASAHPSIESLEDVKVQVHTYDAEMGRTGGGVFNTTLKSGANAFRGTGFFQTRPIWGQTNNYFSEIAGLSEARQPVLSGRRRRRRPHRQEQDVLLVRDRELPRRADPQRLRDDADRGERRGDFSGSPTRRASRSSSTTR